MSLSAVVHQRLAVKSSMQLSYVRRDLSAELTGLGYNSKTMLASSQMNEAMSKGPISRGQSAEKRLSDGRELPLRQSRLCEVER